MLAIIKYLVALAVVGCVTVVGVAFVDIVSAEGWMSGLVFLLILPIFLAVLCIPFALVTSLLKRSRGR
jgi:hypothetical protein